MLVYDAVREGLIIVMEMAWPGRDNGVMAGGGQVVRL